MMKHNLASKLNSHSIFRNTRIHLIPLMLQLFKTDPKKGSVNHGAPLCFKAGHTALTKTRAAESAVEPI